MPGERNRYREPIPFGIDCERCHGPGQAHVEHWSSGRHEPEGAPDPTIVNPERLPAALGMQICLQCHLGDSKATERVPRRDRALADYRPGRPLEDVMVPFSFRDASRTDFGLSAQGYRLLLSRCFQESRGKLQCITCLDPHVSVYRKDRQLEYHREKCLGCHEAGACAGAQRSLLAVAILRRPCTRGRGVTRR